MLRDGGYVCIRNGTRESDFPHRHSFALQPMIDTELPAWAEIAATFESAGFARVTHQVVRQTIAPDWPSFVPGRRVRGAAHVEPGVLQHLGKHSDEGAVILAVYRKPNVFQHCTGYARDKAS